MAEMNFLGRIRHFFGMFNLTGFEGDLIRILQGQVTDEVRGVLDDQLNRFNRVQRIIVDDPRLDCGSTMFYWVSRGKSMIDKFPRRLPSLSEISERVFFKVIVRDSKANEIAIDFVAVYGVFVLLKYRSSARVWYPVGEYRVTAVENLLS